MKYHTPRKKDIWKNDASQLLWIGFIAVLILSLLAVYIVFWA
jgi:hypothetical protein